MQNSTAERRQRAVRLTDEALRVLNARLLEVWSQSGRQGRLTKAGRSELMDVSTKTADRILNRTGNDRLVLIEVFARLGLEWSDEFCEPCRANSKPPAVQPLGPQPEPSIEMPRECAPVRGRRRWLRHAAWLSFALVLCTTGVVLSHKPAAPRMAPTAPRVPLMMRAERLVAEGREAYNKGDYNRAITLARQGHEAAQLTLLADAMAESLRLKGEVMVALGNVDEGIALYEESASLWEAMGLTHGRASLLEVWGQAELRLGRYAEAEKLLSESLEGLRAVGDKGGVAGVARTLGSIAADRGDIDEARRWYQAASEEIADRPAEPMHTDLRSRRALLKRDEGKFAEALADLELSLREWKDRQHPRWIATTLLQMASVHEAAGAPEKAMPLADESRSLFAKVGDQIGVQRCDEMLTRLRMPTPSN